MTGLAPALLVAPRSIRCAPRLPDDLLFEADLRFDGVAILAASIPCTICGVDAGEPCFDEIGQGLPGFHHARLAEAERG